MAEHKEAEQSLMGKISEKIHDHDSSSSSSSDSDSEKPAPEKTELPKEKVFRLFGREKPVHNVLGGGKPADVLLWRNKKISFGVLGAATLVYIIFECVQYHLLTLICHVLVAVLAGLFIYSNAHTLINKTPPNIPEVCLPEEPFFIVASELRHHINWVFALIHNFASGRDLKKFLMVVAGLWVLSIIGSWCNFLTLFYICFLALQIIPALYEKFEHRIDPLAEKATIEMKRQYGVFDEKVLTKARETLLKNKRS